MAIRLICLEEHLIDPALAQAEKAPAAQAFPYRADLGSRFREEPDLRPGAPTSLQAPQRALQLAGAPIDERLAVMDAAGIDMQVLSYSHQVQLLPTGDAIGLARGANDRLAAIMREHPSRFGGFSTLPWQDPEAAVAELRRTVQELGLRATMLVGHPANGALIDDARYEPVLAALEELRVPLYIHPGPPLPSVQQAYYAGFNAELTARLSLYGWGWHNEAGIQVIRLILSRALDRHPGLTIISGHWGEMVPFFLQRMDDTMQREVTGLARSITNTYRDQVFVTPSGMFNLPHFTFCRQVLGADRILFAVDYPYLTLTGARRWIEELPVSEDERAAIAYATAQRLLGITL